MASRQDDPAPYRPGTERLACALVAHDADPERVPLRGAGVATLAGLLVTAIVVGAVGVWARLAGGGAGDDWRDPHALIIEAGTGARYVWREPLLHPVLNYTSAVLVLGDPAPATVTVPRSALDGVPRGPVLGIPGAPESLPPADDLVTGAWTVCAPAAGPPEVTVHTGATPSGGRLLDAAGLLATDGDGAVHLLWRGYRYRVSDAATAASAEDGASPVTLPTGLLAALPSGGGWDRGDLPPLVGSRPGSVVCAVVRDGAEVPDVLVGATPPEQAAGASRPGPGTAVVWVEPGRAVLVTSGTSVQLVTDLGVRHPVAPEALELLGYGAVRPVRVPGEVLALVPAGPVLDPARARGEAPDAATGRA
ncbi:MAG: type VII secretion protein EccB [Micromonosporaceae bacterium]|jgi:type VII secretion protein EccB